MYWYALDSWRIAVNVKIDQTKQDSVSLSLISQFCHNALIGPVHRCLRLYFCIQILPSCNFRQVFDGRSQHGPGHALVVLF